MPAAFNKCVKEGGKVRTISHGDSYLHICYKDGKSYAGEVKQKKMSTYSGVGRKNKHGR